MRLVKAALFAAIVFGVGMMWSNRAYVVDAYRTDEEPTQVRLSGVDLTAARTEIDPSPYTLPAAPDTRLQPPPVLAFVESDDPAPAVSMQGGQARLSGTVRGPDGPVAGAIVSIERHTSVGSASTRLTTGADGTWSASGLLGGRYRVRSWVPAALTMGTSAVTFLPDDGAESFDFELWGIDPDPFLDFVHSGELFHDVPGTVAAVVSRRIIDDNGVVLTVPVPGVVVTLQTTAHLNLLSASTQTTGADGAARYAVVCPPPGSSPSPSPSEDNQSDDGQANHGSDDEGQAATGVEVTGLGSAIVRAGELVGGFSLPTCVPIPPPEVPDGAEGGQTPSGGDNDG